MSVNLPTVVDCTSVGARWVQWWYQQENSMVGSGRDIVKTLGKVPKVLCYYR